MRVAPFLAALALQAQQPGLAPASDTAKLFSDLVAQSARLQPLIQQMKPREWVTGGASVDYIAHWETVSRQNQALASQAQAAAHNPEKLSDAVRLLDRMLAVQETVSELLPPVAKYQNSALAELIAGIQAEGRAARDAYSQRVLDLVNEREQQFQTADYEAQRCRGILSKDPQATRRALKSK